MHLVASLAVILSTLHAQAPFEPVPAQVAAGPHPRAFLTQEEVAQVRDRAANLDWAREVAGRIVAQADALLAQPIDIPHQGGQWSHWYTCEKDGGGLEAKSPTEHVCKTCGTLYTGWPYDDVVFTYQHNRNFSQLDALGIAYVLNPQPEYAERAKAILLEYASFYESLPLHDKDGKQAKSAGRLFAQTLDESVGLCRIARGYDFVHDAPCFTPEDHARIETHFLRPLIDTIRRNDAGISNWQSWHNAGVASAAFVMGDAELADWAVNGKSGFVFQMEKSVTDSGMWYEAAPSYHWYAMLAHLYLLEAAARAGMDLYALPPVKKMFDGPLRQLFPDLTYPALNDSGRSSITGQRDQYEVAYRRFEDPAYLPLLGPRNSEQALLWGVDALPEDRPTRLRLRSTNDPSDGLAVLRDASGQTAVFFDYGPGTSGHVHPAKLGLILYAHGDERLVDPGRLPYGNPLHRGWFTQTLAHNTVVVNETSQKKVPCKLQAFGVTEDFAVVRATCDGAYKGVTIDRALCLAGNVLLDVVHCTSEEDATFDLPLHFRGTLTGLPEGEAVDAIGDKGPYTLLKNTKRYPERLDTATLNTGGNSRIALRFLDASAAFYGEGFGPNMPERLPMLLRRQQGRDAWFITAYHLLENDTPAKTTDAVIQDTGATVSLPGFSLRVGEETRVAVQGEDGEFAVFTVDKGGAKEAEGVL
ncbi:MAG: hypothetical protein AMXMBFR82_10170 [Candidatus Hydrogenedentota bacterium]